MPQPEKRPKKRTNPYFHGIAALAAAALLLLVLVLCLDRPEPAPECTDPTLPPPESNPYLPEDFVYVGDYLTCTVANSRLGIDVSEHQGSIDWAQVKDAGIEFVMVRLGYRGYTEGALYEDTHALANLRGAREAGLQVGAYFYSQAVTVQEAKEEAKFALKVLDGMALDYPLVFDWEYVSTDARTGSLDSRTLTDCTIAFCEAVEKKGYRPMVYFNQDLAAHMFKLEELTDYGFWLAMYSDEMTYPYRVEMWQYTDSGIVPGIGEKVDINLYLP